MFHIDRFSSILVILDDVFIQGTVAGGKGLRREKKPYEREKKMVEVKYQYRYGNDHALQTLSDEIQRMKLCGPALTNTIPMDRIYGIILEPHQVSENYVYIFFTYRIFTHKTMCPYKQKCP